MYADPRDRYGRLVSERFFAARMVVDTGLNVLGWPLDRAAACLRDSGFMSEQEIPSELLRYAVDDPGQALGYHVGHWYLKELRGSRDRRQFHDAVLAAGPSPSASSRTSSPPATRKEPVTARPVPRSIRAMETKTSFRLHDHGNVSQDERVSTICGRKFRANRNFRDHVRRRETNMTGASTGLMRQPMGRNPRPAGRGALSLA